MNFNSCFTLLPPADLAYLASYAVVMVLGVGAGAMVVVAAMSATIVLLSAPAFALAIKGRAVFSGAAGAHCRLIWTYQPICSNKPSAWTNAAQYRPIAR